jgi:hypothetical protein
MTVQVKSTVSAVLLSLVWFLWVLCGGFRRGCGAGVSHVSGIPVRQKAVKGPRRVHSVPEMRMIFDKASAIDDIKSVTGKDLEVTKEGDKVVVSFAYQREIHLAVPAWLTLKYVPDAPNSVATGLVELQRRLQHEFSNAGLLTQALTHRSFSIDHYERLEFLGDSVLNLAVSDLAVCPPGHFARGRFVPRAGQSGQARTPCTSLAVGLGLPDVMRLGEGEVRSGGQKRPSILADTLEAIIGAVYLDAGLPLLRRWCTVCSRRWKSIRKWMPSARIPRPSCKSGCRAAK